MSLEMESQVVRSGEGAGALGALEGSIPGVLPLVPCQLVRSCKPPVATLPVADVWLFTCVRPVMGFQVRTLGVNFVTAVVRTSVRTKSLLLLGIFLHERGIECRTLRQRGHEDVGRDVLAHPRACKRRLDDLMRGIFRRI